MNRILTMASILGIAIAPQDVAEHMRLIDAEHDGLALYEQTTAPLEVKRGRQDRR